jgi:hypothetical protein
MPLTKNHFIMTDLTKVWVPMSNPSERFQDQETQETRDLIKSFEVKILEIDETPNVNQPDVLLEGTKENLLALLQHEEMAYPPSILKELSLL